MKWLLGGNDLEVASFRTRLQWLAPGQAPSTYTGIRLPFLLFY